MKEQNWDFSDGQYKTRSKALHKYKLLRNSLLLEKLFLSQTMQISHEIDLTVIAASDLTVIVASCPHSKTAGVY